MRKAPVYCANCGHKHLLSERVKPQVYSGLTYNSVCPACKKDESGFVFTQNAFNKMKQIREARNA